MTGDTATDQTEDEEDMRTHGAESQQRTVRYLLNAALVVHTPSGPCFTCMYVPNSIQYTVPAMPK